ncbi:hypothetical protein V2I52_24075, partial [Brenneria sp. g21c3]|uniref:hypothetical protein n=1 Tax=Brenneria sp. g21c3 TaxID=3093893 RepID=UPI002EAD71AB|nr:hypothetical protein [Brenneria sp. g21c3]
CSHGRYIQAISDVKIGAFMTLLMPIIFKTADFFLDKGTFWENLLDAVMNNHREFYKYFTAMLVISGAFWGLFFYNAYKAYAPTTCKLAEEIFQVFGWRHPKWINLKKITTKREKELIRQGKWYSPKDTSKPPLPSAKSLWDDEYWHYY